METPWDSSTPISTKPAAASWTTVKFRVLEKDQASARSMPLSGYRARIDTDNDGVPDAIERVLGRDPVLAGFTPPVSLDLSESHAVFEVAAGQPARPRLALKSSNDMGTWVKTQISADFITTLSDGRRRVEVPVPTGAERAFWRL